MYKWSLLLLSTSLYNLQDCKTLQCICIVKILGLNVFVGAIFLVVQGNKMLPCIYVAKRRYIIVVTAHDLNVHGINTLPASVVMSSWRQKLSKKRKSVGLVVVVVASIDLVVQGNKTLPACVRVGSFASINLDPDPVVRNVNLRVERFSS